GTAARKRADLNVRRVRASVRPRDRTRLDRGEAECAVLASRYAPKAPEARIRAGLAAGIAASAVGLPYLDHAVWHRIASAIEQLAGNTDVFADGIGRDEV